MSGDYSPPDGYRGKLLDRLVKEKLRTWSLVKVKKKDGSHYEGVLLPRSQHTADDYLTIKVDTGYNIGIRLPDDATSTSLPLLPPLTRVRSSSVDSSAICPILSPTSRDCLSRVSLSICSSLYSLRFDSLRSGMTA